MNINDYVSKQKESSKRYGLLLLAYITLIMARIVIFPFFFRFMEKPNPLYYFFGGWLLWYVGPLIVSANPLFFKANLLALGIYHILYFACYAYGTSWVKRYWLPAALLPIIAWLSGYLMLLIFASSDIANDILQGTSGW